jgi:hypothetical protein
MLATALSALLLLVELPPAAAGGGQRHFAPVESAAPAAKKKKDSDSRLGRIGKKPVVRHLLHPFGTLRSAAGKSKTGVARAVQSVKIARLERKVTSSGAAGAEPTVDEVRLHAARQARWRHAPHRLDEARALLAERIAVISERGQGIRISEAELQDSARQLLARATGPQALLPVGVEPARVSRLVAMGMAAVAGRAVYGAPEGAADVLENPLVGLSVVERTIAGTRDWLTDNQREVLEEALADGDLDLARVVVGKAYHEGVEAVLSTASAYQTEEIDISGGGELPLSLRAAIRQRPDLADGLFKLESQGIKLRVRTMVKTPSGVRSAALEYGAFGEETEFSPFVAQVSKGIRPDPRPTPMGVMRAIAAGRFSRQRPPTAVDLERRIDLVDRAVDQVLVIEATGPGAEGAADTLAAINRALAPVRRVMAVHRIVFDVKHEAGEGARKLLPMVAGLAAVATGLQAAGAGKEAILVAEGGEDILQGAVEGASQDGQMRTRQEVWRPSTKLAAAGALGLSVALAGPIHHLAEHGMGYVAGPLMGVGSMALSGTVFGNAVALNYKGRVARLKAGKVADTVPQLMFDKDFQRQLKNVGRTARTPAGRRAAILHQARRALLARVGQDVISTAEMRRTMEALEGTADEPELRAMITRPSRRALVKAAFGEALGTPTRLALGQGMILTIAASSVVGAVGLLSGPAWGMAIAVMASAGEGLWGLYRSYRFEKENRRSEEKALRTLAGI